MMQRRIAIVGGGMSGLGAAKALHNHPNRFDFRLFEANEQLGGNAVTVDMPQGRRQFSPVRYLSSGVHLVGVRPRRAVVGTLRD